MLPDTSKLRQTMACAHSLCIEGVVTVGLYVESRSVVVFIGMVDKRSVVDDWNVVVGGDMVLLTTCSVCWTILNSVRGGLSQPLPIL